MDISTLMQTLIDWAVGLGQRVDDLPGTTAFGLGLFTWFAVEQILRRMVNILRWGIVIAILAGLGLSIPYLTGLMAERGGEPALEGVLAPSYEN